MSPWLWALIISVCWLGFGTYVGIWKIAAATTAARRGNSDYLSDSEEFLLFVAYLFLAPFLLFIQLIGYVFFDYSADAVERNAKNEVARMQQEQRQATTLLNLDRARITHRREIESINDQRTALWEGEANRQLPAAKETS